MFCGPGSLSHVFPLQVLSLSYRVCHWSPSSCWLHLLKCPAGNLQAHPLGSMAGSNHCCLGSSGISSSFDTSPGALLWLRVCAWRHEWLQRARQITAACSMERCQCFKGGELWPLNVLSVAVRVEVPWRMAVQCGWELREPGLGWERSPGLLATLPASTRSPGHRAAAGPCPGVVGRGRGLHLASSLSCAPLGKESMI